MRNLIKNITFLTLAMTCCCYVCSDCAAIAHPNDFLEQSAVKNVNMDRYIVQTRRKIKNNWYPPTSSYENSATLVVKVDRNGHLLDCHLVTPSPDDGFNESLINAAKKSVFSPLPDDFPYANLEMNFDFSMQRRYKFKDQ